MKPNFALSLTLEGIRLLHRDGAGGWTPVGSVRLDSPDLAGDLAALRQQALALEPGGLAVKLVLPNDQVRYIALDTTRTTEADVLAALDGATPYAAAELVHDHVKGGGRTYIAAVARETLAEAEAFAANHGFRPIAFAAVPEPFTYVGEVFFGPTALAATLLPDGAQIAREETPIPWAIYRGRAPLPPLPVPPSSTPPAAAADLPPEDAHTDGPPPTVAPDPIPDPDPATPLTPAPMDPAGGLAPAAPAPDGPPPVRDPMPAAQSAAAAVVAAGDLANLGVPRAQLLNDAAGAPAPDARGDAPSGGDTPDRPDRQAASYLATGVPAPAEGAAPLPPAQAVPAEPAAASADGGAMPAPAGAVPDPLPSAMPAMPDAATDPAMPVFAARPRPPRMPKAPKTDQPTPEAEPVFVSRARSPKTRPPVAPPPPEPVFTRRLPPPLVTPGRPPAATTPPPAAATIPPRAAPGARAAILPPVTATGPGLSVSLPPRPTLATAATAAAAAPRPPEAAPAPVKPAAPVEAAAAVPTPAPIPTIALRGASADQLPAPQAAARGGVMDRLRQRGDPVEPPPLGFDRLAAARQIGGRPRFVGAALVLGLVVVLGAAAVWSTGAGGALTALLGSGATAATGAADPSVTETAALAAAPDAAAAPADVAPADVAPEVATETDPGASLAAAVTEAALALPEPADTAADLPLAAAPPLPDPAAPEPGLPEVAPSTEPGGLERAALAAIAQPGSAVSAAEADRFYAATGVWLRAPRLPLLPQGEADAGLALPDPVPAVVAAAAPVLPAVGPDPGLPRQSNPPPPGTSYPRDAQGNVLATPEGTLLPSGILVFAAAPPLNPPTRPGTPPPPPPPFEVAPEAAAAPEAAVPPVQPMAVAPATGPVLRPASVLARAAALAPVAPDTPPEAAPDPAAAAPVGTAAPLGGLAWDGLRPATRPEALVPEAVVQTDFAGPRPPLRPAGLAPEPPPEPEVAPEEPAPLPAGQTPIAAPGPTDVTEALVAIVAAAPDPLRGATEQAVAVARRPDMRPRNFDRVVARAQDRLARAAATTGAGAGGVGTGALEPEEQAETEPEVASAAAAAPSGPIPGGVADAATLENAIALREINLIGVYGRPDDRRALVRLANGRYLRVSVGDNLDGGRVAAIGDNSLNYTRSGRTITLEIPNG